MYRGRCAGGRVNSLRTSAVRGAALSAAAFFVLHSTVLRSTPCLAQQAPVVANAKGDHALPDPALRDPALPDPALRDLQDQVRQLRGMLDEMRAEYTQSRAEMRQLRQDLQTTRAMLERAPGTSQTATAQIQASQNQPSQSRSSPYPESASQPNQPPVTTAAAPAASTGLEERIQKLEETTSLIGDKIDEQYQTKVETASKYRARLHGIVLMNAFRNVGGADSFDFPDYSQQVSGGAPEAALGATLRQSEIGLEIFGPNLAGARTSADVQMDFAGGFAQTGNGVNFGIVRLQTANLRFDWAQTSLVAGQDSLFISPLSPTSFASLATPAFAYAGNLWGWTPQLRIEHRFSVSDQQTLTVQAGVLDNVDWEYPPDPYYRYPQAGEMSGQPAYALRTSWSHPVHEHPLSFGVASYYGRQNWNWGRYVDAWAGMADWQLPIAPRLSLSGEFYRGRGIGGLGAAQGLSVVYGGSPALSYTAIRGVNDEGGWSQLKFQLTRKVELNGVIADDNAITANIRGFAFDQPNAPLILGRNRGAFGNVVFRPRSDLVLSAELRRLQSFPVYSSESTTNQVNLAVGILF